MQNSQEVLAGLTMDCLVFASRRSARAITNYVNMLLRPLDLSTAQFGLLAALAKTPERSLREISQSLVLDESTMVRNLAVLERRGLAVSEGGRGRAGKRISLTEDGWALLAAGAEIWKQANLALEQAFAPADALAGRQFMEALAQASDQLSATGTTDQPLNLGDGVD